jgi:hypothetical protein
MKQAFLDFGETLKENGKHWEDNTQAGLNNQAALRDMVDTIKEKRDAEIAHAQSIGATQAQIDEINRKFDKNIERLKEMALKAGMTEDAFHNLAGTYTINFVLNQIAGKQVMAWSELRNQERQLAVSNSSGPIVNGKIKEFASGGTTPAGEVFKVHKDEYMFSNKQHYVATASQSRALEGGGGAMVGGVTVNVAAGTEHRVRDFIVMAVRDATWSLGGGNVQKAFGR